MSSARAEVRSVQPWTVAAMAVAVGASGIAALFQGTVAEMVDIWMRSASFNHGFAILPISLWLVWERRHSLSAVTPWPSLWPLPVIAVLALGWLLAAAAEVQVVQQLAVVGMLQALVVATVGWAAARRMAFPLFFLVFMVPMGEFLVPHLQQVTAEMAVASLRLVGVPVFLEGNFITTPFGNFHVAEACSGLRFLTASAAVGTLFANQMFTSTTRRLLFVAAALIVPVIANGIRAFGIILLARELGIAAAEGIDHIIYGWVFFSLVTLLLLLGGWAFREPLPPEPQDDEPDDRSGGGFRPLPVMGVAALAVAAAAVGPVWLYQARAAAVPDLAAAPLPVPGAQPQEAAADGWRPAFPGADVTLFEHVPGEPPVDRFVAFYHQQRDGAELIATQNVLIPETWTRLDGGRATFDLPDGPLEVRRLLLGREDARREIWTWYWVDGTRTASATTAKLLQARSLLLGGDPAAATLAVSIGWHEGDAVNPRQALARFLRDERGAARFPRAMAAQDANRGD